MITATANSEVVAYIDGASHGNPGPAGIGIKIEHASHHVDISQYIGEHDNNYAEYCALLAALRYAIQNGCTRVRVFSDSEVVVRQINGHYSCQSPLLRQIYELCLSLIVGLEAFTLTHIRREHNFEADNLARAGVYKGLREKRRKPLDQQPALAEAFA